MVTIIMMREKVKQFYEKNKPAVVKAVYTTVGVVVGVVAVLVIAAITYEPTEEFDKDFQKEYTTIDGETKIYNPFEDPATGLGDDLPLE